MSFHEDFLAALSATEYRFGRCFDASGKRVALVVTTRQHEGRFSSLGGWTDGDDYVSSAVFMAEDGRELAVGEWVSTDENDLRQCDGYSLNLAGINCIPATSATSDWLPRGAIPPGCDGIYRAEWDCEAAWNAAFEDRRSAKAAAKSTSAAPVQQTFTLADLAKLQKRK